jgi:hypothetical protein
MKGSGVPAYPCGQVSVSAEFERFLKDSPELVRIDVKGEAGAASPRRLSYGFRERAICKIGSAGLRFQLRPRIAAPSVVSSK